MSDSTREALRAVEIAARGSRRVTWALVVYALLMAAHAVVRWWA